MESVCAKLQIDFSNFSFDLKSNRIRRNYAGKDKLKSSEPFKKNIRLIDAKQNAEATAVVAARGIPGKSQCDLKQQSIQFELSRLK